MTWAEFNASVRVYLPNHTRRQGIQALLDQLIRAACVDMQSAVPSFATGNSNEYGPDETTTDGFSSVGTLPDGQITAAYLVARDADTQVIDYTNRTNLTQIPWADRNAMTAGLVEENRGYIAVDPQSGMFRIAPALDDTFRLVLEWTGIKFDYAQTDRVKFNPQVAQAVAEYVLARITRMIDKDMTIASSHEKTYVQLKRRVRSEERAREMVGP